MAQGHLIGTVAGLHPVRHDTLRMRCPLPPVGLRPARGLRIIRRIRQTLTLVIGVILVVAGISETGGRDAIVLTMTGLVTFAYALVSLTEK